MSLKAELLGQARPVPEFRLVLPAGWAEYGPDSVTEQELLHQAKLRLREAHRPDLAVELSTITRRAFSQMRRADTLAFYMGLPPEKDTILPLSITVSKRVAPNGTSLDNQVADLIRNYGARPLNDDQVVLRWETSQTHQVGSERVATQTVSYLIPIPGTGRREALLFVGVVPHPIELTGDDSVVASYIYYCDVIMSTFVWTKK